MIDLTTIFITWIQISSYDALKLKIIARNNMCIIHLSNYLGSSFFVVSNKNLDIKWNPIKCNHLSY